MLFAHYARYIAVSSCLNLLLLWGVGYMGISSSAPAPKREFTLNLLQRAAPAPVVPVVEAPVKAPKPVPEVKMKKEAKKHIERADKKYGIKSIAITEMLPAIPSPQPTVSNTGKDVSTVEQVRRNVKPLQQTAPFYPPGALRRKQEGTVLLHVQVGGNGKVRQIKLAQSSGFEALDTAAEQAVREWVFSPAYRNGEAVESWVEAPITFRIQ